MNYFVKIFKDVQGLPTLSDKLGTVTMYNDTQTHRTLGNLNRTNALFHGLSNRFILFGKGY